MAQRVYVRKAHGFVEFPDSFTDEQIHALLLRDFPPDDPTIGQTAKSAFGAAAQGAAGVASSIPKAGGIIQGAITGQEPEETNLYQFGQGIEDKVETALPEDPRLKGKSFMWSTLPQALGSTAGFAATGMAGELAAPARLARLARAAMPAATGAAAGGVEGYEDAKASGADREGAFTATLLNALVGTSEAVSLDRIFTRINKQTKGALKHLVEGATSAVEEGTQEAFQQTAANIIAENLYDEDRETIKGVLEGGAAGAASGFLMTVLGKGVRRVAGAPSEDKVPPVMADIPKQQPAATSTPGDESGKVVIANIPRQEPEPYSVYKSAEPGKITVDRSLLEQLEAVLKGNQGAKPEGTPPPNGDTKQVPAESKQVEADTQQAQDETVTAQQTTKPALTEQDQAPLPKIGDRVELKGRTGTLAEGQDGNLTIETPAGTSISLDEDDLRHVRLMAALNGPDTIFQPQPERAPEAASNTQSVTKQKQAVVNNNATDTAPSSIATVEQQEKPSDPVVKQSLTTQPALTPAQPGPTVSTASETITGSNERVGSEMPAEGKAAALPPRATPDLIDAVRSILGKRALTPKESPRAADHPEHYDGGHYAEFFKTGYGRLMIRQSGKMSPRDLVKALIKSGHVQPTFTVSDLWRSLMETVHARRAQNPVQSRRKKITRESPDLIDIIQSTIGSMRVIVAKGSSRATRYQDLYDSGDYADFIRTGFGRRLVSNTGKLSPDQVVQSLIHGGDVQPGFSVEDLWRGLMNAVRERQALKPTESAETKALNKEAAAASDFARRAIRKTDKKGGVVPASSLGVGDVFTVDGAQFTVSAIEEDEQGNPISVTVQDGRRFGTQHIDGNLYLKADPDSFKENKPAATEPDDDIPFAVRSRPASGMTQAAAQAVVDRLAARAPGAVPTVVVQSVSDLPKPLQRRGAQGVLWKGRVYLVADNLDTEQEAESKWLHEQVGHHGLRSLLGEQLKPMLEAVFRAYKGTPELQRIAKTYGLDLQDQADQMEAAEELLAHLAEHPDTNPSLWRSIVVAFRRAWRAIAGGEISEEEVKELIYYAYRHVESVGLKQEQGAARFSLKDDSLRDIDRGMQSQDKEYLTAVKRGDMEDAQKMVDTAAALAGYGNKLWHWTTENFETFKDWSHFGTYTQALNRSDYKQQRVGITDSYRKLKPGERFMSVFLPPGKSIKMEDPGVWEVYSDKFLKELVRSHVITASESRAIKKKEGALYGKGGSWQQFLNEWKHEIERRLKTDGVDRILYNNAFEHGSEPSILLLDGSVAIPANPVLYDDAGNVITLSKRFPTVTHPDDKPPPRFALKPEDYQSKHDELTKRIVAARSSGDVKDAKAARTELDALEKEQFGYSAKRSDDDSDSVPKTDEASSSSHRSTAPAAKQPGSAVQSSPQPELSPAQVRRVVRDIQGATANPTLSVDSWWTMFKLWSRKWTNAIPELPTHGKELVAKFAAVRRWYRAVSSETEMVRKKAERRIKSVLDPLANLERSEIDPNTLKQYESLTNKIQREQAKGDRANTEHIEKWDALREALMPALSPNPFFIFRNIILWRDIATRVQFMKTDDGQPITPPGGLSIEQVITETNRADAAKENSPHRAAITEALNRHYQLVKDLQQELEDHGEIIPEAMKNPDYFPHHVLENWTGRLAPIRATTEGPWRPYLMPITGTVKLHQSDYLAAMYKHVSDVMANNAQVDLVERDIRPYDIAKQHLEQLTEKYGEELAKKLLYDPRHLPPGHTVIRPSERLKLAATYIIDRATLSERLGRQLTDGDLQAQIKAMGGVKLTAEDIREALTVGDQTRWIVPDEVAAALEGISKREEAEANPGFGASLMKPLATLQKLWKINTLHSPLNWPRYEFGNTMTDVIDKVFGLDPTIAKYLKRALTEIREGAKDNPTPEYDAALREGVFQTITAGEADEIATMKGFDEFMSDGDKRMANWNKLWRATTGLSNLRESTFRYAKFLADLERLEKGERPVYGGAYHVEVDAQQTNYQKAGLISRKTFGDYTDISPAGQFLRRYVFPFWSWQEVNLKYHVNLARNMVEMAKLGDILAARNAGRALAVRTTMGAVGIAFRLAIIRLGVEMWNQIGGPLAGLWDDDDDLESQLSEADRRRLHMILGKDSQGRVRVVYLPSAIADVTEWFGGNNFARLAGDWIKGDISFERFAKDYAKQVPGDALNKVVQGVRPEAKFAYMMASGKDPFPDVVNQRSIDRSEWYWMLGQAADRDVTLALRSELDPYFYSPESAGDWWQRKLLQVRRRDPEQWAYFEIRELASDWKEEKTGKRSEGGLYTSPDQKVVRNFRRAIYNADMVNAEKFYLAALDLGYTRDRFKASLRAQDPLADLNQDQRKEFMAELNPYEQRMLRLAQAYYGRIAAGKGKEAVLFPKKAGAPFTPRPDRLQEMMGGR